jgi:hypothetical protein
LLISNLTIFLLTSSKVLKAILWIKKTGTPQSWFMLWPIRKWCEVLRNRNLKWCHFRIPLRVISKQRKFAKKHDISSAIMLRMAYNRHF